MPIVKCDYCGKEVNKPNWEIKDLKHIYCSKECRKLASKKIELICKNCNKIFTRYSGAIKKNKNIFCSKQCYINYINTNKYIIEGDTTKIILKSATYGIKEVLIDIEDVERLKKFCWGIHYFKRQKEFYISTNIHYPSKKTLLLHRYIMNCPDDKVIDHKSHDTLDNRKSNLRICTIKQNNENLLSAKKNNKSTGIRGVHYNKRDKVYQVCIGHEGKIIHLGRYKTLEEAEKAAIEARKKYFTHSPECESA